MAIHTTISASRLPAVLTVLFATSIASGFGYYCAPFRVRVTNADTIVVGRTTNVTHEEVRPTLRAVTYEFHVDRVLKGDLYKAGDTIVKRYEPDQRMIGYHPFPWDFDEGLHLLFVNRNEGGNERFACAASVADVDLDSIRRQIEVQDDPPAFLESDSEQDVTTVLDWIKRTYVRYEPKGGSHADWSDRSSNRETVIRYLLKQARGDRDDLCVAALNVLALIHPPEAFDVFKKALRSANDGDKIALAAKGLSGLGDDRAVPLLLDRFTDLREEKAKRARRGQEGAGTAKMKLRSYGWQGPPHRRNPERELRAAITSFDDPRVKQFFVDSLSEGDNRSTLSYLGQLEDPRAVEPLLRSLWQGNSSAIEPLLKYDDDRITEEARERLYDHPMAPRLLAARGDPSARAFMTRLVRQGFREGFTWAAVAKEESVKADLVRALAEYSGSSYYMHRVAYALGRIRAFDIAASILDKDLSDSDAALQAAEMLAGLSDRSFGVQDGCPPDEFRNCIGQSLREVGEREEWAKSEVELAHELLNAFVDRENPPTRYNIGSIIPRHPWSPPESLPDMPDPLDKEATARYLEQNMERCKGVLHDGSVEDQSKVLQAAHYCETNILDRDTLVKLLIGSDWRLRSMAHSVVTSGRLVLSMSDVERWALTGDFQSTRTAIGYIRRHPKPEYAPIVTKVFLHGRHLFVDTLFEAIIETDATDCIDLLRAYLENEHYALRMNAAITLIHLGDDAGEAVLAELEPNLRTCSRCMSGVYRQEALDRLN